MIWHNVQYKTRIHLSGSFARKAPLKREVRLFPKMFWLLPSNILCKKEKGRRVGDRLLLWWGSYLERSIILWRCFPQALPVPPLCNTSHNVGWRTVYGIGAIVSSQMFTCFWPRPRTFPLILTTSNSNSHSSFKASHMQNTTSQNVVWSFFYRTNTSLCLGSFGIFFSL